MRAPCGITFTQLLTMLPLYGLLIWLVGVTAFAVLIVVLYRLSFRAAKALEGVSAQRATILMLETRVAMLENTVRALKPARGAEVGTRETVSD